MNNHVDSVQYTKEMRLPLGTVWLINVYAAEQNFPIRATLKQSIQTPSHMYASGMGRPPKMFSPFVVLVVQRFRVGLVIERSLVRLLFQLSLPSGVSKSSTRLQWLGLGGVCPLVSGGR